MISYKYDENMYHVGTQECQIDPIATKRSGRMVWLLPADCTWEEPLEEKEGYKVKWNGEEWEYEEIPAPPEPEPPTLDEVKANKIAEFKSIRDAKEVDDIQVNGYLYDYDEKARERINAAIIALDLTGGTITWTLADNTDTEVSANTLRYVIAMVAQRSNELHVKYRNLKERVESATTKAQVERIVWDE